MIRPFAHYHRNRKQLLPVVPPTDLARQFQGYLEPESGAEGDKVLTSRQRAFSPLAAGEEIQSPPGTLGENLHYQLMNGPLAGLCIEVTVCQDRFHLKLSTGDASHYSALEACKQRLLKRLSALPYYCILDISYVGDA